MSATVAPLPRFRRDSAHPEPRGATQRRFVMKSDGRSIRKVVQLVETELSCRVLCNEATRMQIELALVEALANALYHGNLEMNSELRDREDQMFLITARRRRRLQPYRDRRIYIELIVAEEKAVITIRDDGVGFDPAAIPDPSDPDNVDRISGRGIFLMRSVMDSVTFNERGNEVRMVKRWYPVS
jgi:anti-sigma regulatory factor (Ser/Thr protein kinase)